jgi:hypothetical protein
MKRAIRCVCLLVAGFAFLTFTYSRADDQVQRERQPGPQDPRPLRVPGTEPGKGSSGPLQPKQEAPKPGVAPAAGKQKYEPTKFVQIKRDQNGKPLFMQTAIARYVPEKAAKGQEGLVVDLVSVVHIADRKYFDKLNTRFEDYDAVLFELVMPKGAKVPKGGPKGGGNPLSMLQDMMTLVLQVDLQTRCIDYTCTNFVHADMSPEELAASIQKKGDNSLSLILSIAADLIREQNKMQGKAVKPGMDFDPLSLLTDPQGPAKLKIMMAEQLEQMADGTGLGKTLNQLLIDERNAACMKVYQQQVAAGKKKIAIFYGAAHMPDFERRLIEEFGMKRQNLVWYDAWDLTPKAINPIDLLKFLN